MVLVCAMTLEAWAQKDVQQMADSIVKYQMKSGGWAKNQYWLDGPDPEEAKVWRKTGIGSTIDNGATIAELATLAKAVDQIVVMLAESSPWLDTDMLKVRRKTYTESFKRGVEFLLKMQYENGGFPQYFPPKKQEDYSSQITFNDNAMVNALKMLRDVAGDSLRFRNMAVDKGTKKKCQEAYRRGIQCILFCQIRVDEQGRVLEFDTPSWKSGRLTVWCQQHDKQTFAPTKARTYELPAYTAQGETCAILDLLMDEPNPSSEVRAAVKGGVEWLEAHALKDVAVESFVNEQGQKDGRGGGEDERVCLREKRGGGGWGGGGPPPPRGVLK